MANRKINWDKHALDQFNLAINYISDFSTQSAEKVRVEIIEIIAKLPLYPERYGPDKYKKNNNGHYRAFELHRLRIAYYVSSEEIRVLRVRSTYQEPLEY